jgi:uncharacterized repeat protein (TIGR01451 family)
VTTEGDADSTNNSSDDPYNSGNTTLPVPTPVVQIIDPFMTKVANPPFATAGEAVVWTITVTNPGQIDIQNVSVVDEMPPE